VIGARTDGSKSTGAAWVFTRSGEAWSQQGGKLTASGEGPDGELGEGVALSGDGNTALLGAYADRGLQGSAWVFTRSGGAWAQREELTGTEAIGTSRFGASVALSSEGTAALVGGYSDNAEVGAAWVFAGPLTTPGTPLGPPFSPAPGGSTSAPGASSPTPPVLAGLAESNRVWREGHKPASLSRASRKAHVGTIFSFTLNEPAQVSFDFTRQVTGRSVGHACVPATPKNERRRHCMRTVAEGSLGFTGHAGADRVQFAGVIASSRKLPLGLHTVSIRATNPAGQHSSSSSLRFTIVR
jgi:hypothetical protein